MIHPISYPCGCVFAFEVDLRGWVVLDKREHRGQSKDEHSKLCEIHADELRKLGLWK